MKLLCLLLIVVLVPSICFADLADENLLLKLPQGYKIDFRTRKGRMIMTEMVPLAETVNDWSEMVTTQIFLGMKNMMPEQFQVAMKKGWLSACKDGEVASITSGEENGYAFSLWVQMCPLNPSTGKPEKTWFKAIKGNDSFYVVQKAFKFDPTKDQMRQWMQYFHSVVVCDTRLPERSCPKVNKAAQ